MGAGQDSAKVDPGTSVSELLARVPSTREIFLQQGPLYEHRAGTLTTTYDPELTVESYAEHNGLAVEPLVALLAAAVESGGEETERRRLEDVRWGPPEPPLGGTAATSELRRADLLVARVVEVQTARGPE